MAIAVAVAVVPVVHRVEAVAGDVAVEIDFTSTRRQGKSCFERLLVLVYLIRSGLLCNYPAFIH